MSVVWSTGIQLMTLYPDMHLTYSKNGGNLGSESK